MLLGCFTGDRKHEKYKDPRDLGDIRVEDLISRMTLVEKIGQMLQLLPGHTFIIEAGKQPLRNKNSLALFSNIEVSPLPDEKNEGSMIIELKVEEFKLKLAEVSTEWSISIGQGGCPTLASLQPGGTITVEHQNLLGLNRSLTASVTTSNFFNPQAPLY